MAEPRKPPSRTLLYHTNEFLKQFTALSVDHTTSRRRVAVDTTPPAEFDGRVVWKKYIPRVRNQGECGSCWAFATTSCLAIRLAIATRGGEQVTLSPAAMVICNLGGEDEYKMAMDMMARGLPYDRVDEEDVETTKNWEMSLVRKLGCQGETLIGAWQYIMRFGVGEETCVPYHGGEYEGGIDLGTATDLPSCGTVLGNSYDMCPTKKKPMRRHRVWAYYYVPGTTKKKNTEDVEDSVGDPPEPYETKFENAATMLADADGSEETIRREIWHWGPVTTGFSVYSDFMAWDGLGVYHHVKNDKGDEEPMGHAVVIVGWGETPEPHWIVRNSWGKAWGEGGYFKIRRGTNECGIEENVFVGFPELPGFRLYTDHPLLFVEEDMALRSIWRVMASGHKQTTIERMLDGTLPPDAADAGRLIYDDDDWPALNSYIAGKPNKTKFPLRRPVYISLFRPRNEVEWERSNRALMLVFLTSVLITVVYLSNKNKK